MTPGARCNVASIHSNAYNKAQAETCYDQLKGPSRPAPHLSTTSAGCHRTHIREQVCNNTSLRPAAEYATAGPPMHSQGSAMKARRYACSQGLPVLDVSALPDANASVVRGACFGRRMGTECSLPNGSKSGVWKQRRYIKDPGCEYQREDNTTSLDKQGDAGPLHPHHAPRHNLPLHPNPPPTPRPGLVSPVASGPRPGAPPPPRYLRGNAEALEDVVEEQLLQLQLHGHVAIEGRAEQPAQRLRAAQVVAHLRLGAGPAAGPAAARRQRAEPQQGLGGDGGVGGGPARPRLEGAVVDHQRHRVRRPDGRARLQHRVRGPARIAEGEHPRARRHFAPVPGSLRPGTLAPTHVPGSAPATPRGGRPGPPQSASPAPAATPTPTLQTFTVSVTCVEGKTRDPGLCQTALGGHRHGLCFLKASPAFSLHISPFSETPPTCNPNCVKWGLQTSASLKLGSLMAFLTCLPDAQDQVPSAEEIKKQSSYESDSDSKFENELPAEENQNDICSTETQEEIQSIGSLEKLRPKPAYLSSKPKSQKQSCPAAISDSWSHSQKIKPSRTEKSDLCNIVMLLCTMLSSLAWNFICQLLHVSNVLRIQLLPSSLTIYTDQLFVLLGEKIVKILGFLRLESRGLLTSVSGRRHKKSGTE
ncbi:uncharacterized protein VSU04_011456 [Chlamydotis macqueenii]